MRRTLAALLLVALTLPAVAAPRNRDDGPRFFERIFRVLAKVSRHLVPMDDLGVPKP